MKLDIRIDKYRIWFLIYGILYTGFFSLLEKIRTGPGLHIIHTSLDEKIPFCEFFIVPYFSWFLYVGIILFYVTWTWQGSDSFKSAVISMVVGTSIFLFISFIFPNAQDLRPEVFARNNIFVTAVKWLYQIDTPTNVLPSLHVYVSIMMNTIVLHDKNLRENRGICCISIIWASLIIMSTMLLKQHSIIDVIAAMVLAKVMNLFLYREQWSVEPNLYMKKRVKKKYSNQLN
ncbi:MAG: phosphatase PAP2 family protein [Lachnospiraceae bacterium]